MFVGPWRVKQSILFSSEQQRAILRLVKADLAEGIMELQQEPLLQAAIPKLEAAEERQSSCKAQTSSAGSPWGDYDGSGTSKRHSSNGKLIHRTLRSDCAECSIFATTLWYLFYRGRVTVCVHISMNRVKLTQGSESCDGTR